MDKLIKLHATRLLKAHGNYSDAARHIRVMPRTFRLYRAGKTSALVNTLISHASQALYLRLLLKALRKSGAVSPEDLQAAVASVNRLLAPKDQ